MKSLNSYIVLTLCFYLFSFSKIAHANQSPNKFYFEPFFKIDYEIWENNQTEIRDGDGDYDFKFRGLYWGPRVGAKILGIYNNWWIYGFEGSYAYLFNTYNPDPGSSDEAKVDDNFVTDSSSSQVQVGIFTGFQYQRFGLKLQYIPISYIENEAFHSTSGDPNLSNKYAGTGMGIGISYIYRPKVNFYFEYQTFKLNTLTVDGQEYNLPTTVDDVTLNGFTTVKYSLGISYIF